MSLLINKQMNLPILIKVKSKKYIQLQQGKTTDLMPEGEFTIMIKAKDPYYRKKNIEGGAKNNPLGRRWIGFDARKNRWQNIRNSWDRDETSIGKFITAGCVRLHNQDVELLFDRFGNKSMDYNLNRFISEKLAKDKQATR
ncbi:L,D-transpeptidase [Bacillus sp. SL00103]